MDGTKVPHNWYDRNLVTKPGVQFAFPCFACLIESRISSIGKTIEPRI